MKENLLKKRKKKGFTLIELIVVIAIIAIIALIAIPKVMGYQDDAKKKADIANAKTIANVVAAEITNGNIASNRAFTNIEIDGASEITEAPQTPVTSNDNAEYYINKNLQSIPKVQSGKHPGNYFYVNIDANSNVTVYDSASSVTDKTKLYPAD